MPLSARARALAPLILISLSITVCITYFTAIPKSFNKNSPFWILSTPSHLPAPKPSTSPSVAESTPSPRYKPPPVRHPPLKENFPLASHASSPTDLPPIPTWNVPPNPHLRRDTPVFIGFTRNWFILQQAVVSYLTAGWPASDIYVVENTGTQSSNRDNLLTPQNPFYLDYHRLTKVFGINIVSTPAYLTFSQLQNFFIWYSGEKGWDYYFWSHMDVVALSDETYTDEETGEDKSLYLRAVDTLNETLSPNYGKWAIRLFAYDRLALVNRNAYMDVGGWDPMIGYYGTDCDMHERLAMKGYEWVDAHVGLVYDIGSSLDDLLVLYRQNTTRSSSNTKPNSNPTPDTLASLTYHNLTHTLDAMQSWKNANIEGRNIWQKAQSGGQGEAFYIDPDGFDTALWKTVELGKEVMENKWGHRGCGLREAGLHTGDAWRVEKDWE
ncbi:MAG: hypothetical protein Q9187_004326 [Circinaria calcarea]